MVLSTETLSCLKTFKGHDDYVSAFALDQESKRL